MGSIRSLTGLRRAARTGLVWASAIVALPVLGAPYVCLVQVGPDHLPRFPRIDATDPGDAHCRAESFAQRPGHANCVPAEHVAATTCVAVEPDPAVDRKAARAGAPAGPRRAYQCPVPGTQFQQWLQVEGASAADIVAEMNKQTRNFSQADQCMAASAYAALTQPGGATSQAAAPMAAAAAPGTLTRAEVFAASQALADLRIERVRNIEQRRDADDSAAVMARLQPVEASMAAEWAALPPDPLARMRQLLIVRSKYQPIFGYLRQRLVEQGPQNTASPVIAAARRLEPAANAQIVAAMAQPQVKQAWLDGTLPLPLELLSREERIEWQADRSTASLARDAAAQANTAALFMRRTEDLEQSRREREQADAYAKWGEPTAHEIGLALLRAVAFDGGRQTTPFEAERIGPTHLLLELSGTSLRFATRVVHVQKSACARIAPGWSCDVRLWVQDFVRGAQQDMLAAVGATPVHRAEIAFRAIGIASAQLAGQPARLTLAASRAGWTAPEFAAAIHADEQTVTEQMRRMAQKAQDDERCRVRNIQIFGWDNHQSC